MQGYEGTSLRILPVSQDTGSTSNLEKREPTISLVPREPPSLPFFPAQTSSDPPAYVPYQAFLALVSFVASIVFSLGISAAQTFSTSQSFFGSNIPNAGALSDALFRATKIFAWAGALAAIGLIMSMALQLLLTSPKIMKGMLNHRALKAMVMTMAWFSVIVVCGGIVCVAEAIKVIDQKAGLTIQWSLLAVVGPLVAWFWAHL